MPIAGIEYKRYYDMYVHKPKSTRIQEVVVSFQERQTVANESFWEMLPSSQNTNYKCRKLNKIHRVICEQTAGFVKGRTIRTRAYAPRVVRRW